MNLVMNAKITFPPRQGRGRLEIRKITGALIETSWEALTDTATIILARNVSINKAFNKIDVKNEFKVGDPVSIELGYDGHLIKEFEGFITEVSADVPIKIKCEDAMYTLKRHSVNISLAKTSLMNLLEKTVPEGFKIDAANVELGTVKFAKTTVAKMLEKLQDDYNLYSYIKDFDTLVVGKIYADDTQRSIHKFDFTRNVIQNNLNYKNKEDIRIKIKAVSTLSKGKTLTVEVGDADGVLKQLAYYNIELEAELTKLAKQDYDKFKIDGFDGSFEVFGRPSLRHGDRVELISGDPDAEIWLPGQYPDRNGVYFIKKIVKTYDDTPKYHQVVTLDRKAI